MKKLKKLPIDLYKSKIIDALQKNQVLIIHGETGSGKSTRLPLICRESSACGRNIAVTQPRRIAALSLAERVSEELGEETGSTAGYRIRFNKKVSKKTEIDYLTDGVLLNEIRKDRKLKKYDVIIVDEAHERSLNIDCIAGFLKILMSKRSDIRIIISSATLNIETFSSFFNNPPVIKVTGTMYPVETLYRPPEDQDQSCIPVIREIADTEESGDILLFSSTERDIKERVRALEKSFTGRFRILPLFSRLPLSKQREVFSRSSKQKIVVATNIAETSVTVPGIRFVIDTGKARIKRYSPVLRANRLPIEPVSKANCDQRKGRCGRVSEGICIRLFSEEDYKEREDFPDPEIRRSNLSGLILMMEYYNLGDISDFPMPDPPTPSAVRNSKRELRELGALNRRERITPTGRYMAALPLEPHVSRMVIEGAKQGVIKEILIIAAGLSIPDPRIIPEDKTEKARGIHREFESEKSDFITLLNIWRKMERERVKSTNRLSEFCRRNFLSFQRLREWQDIYSQIKEISKGISIPKLSTDYTRDERIHRSILSGLISSICVRNERGTYTSPSINDIFIFPGSAFIKKKPEWIVAHEIVETSKIFARTVSEINPEWAAEFLGDFTRKRHINSIYNPETESVTATEITSYKNLELTRKEIKNYGAVNRDKANDIFIREALIEDRLKTTPDFIKRNNSKLSSIYKRFRKSRRKTPELKEELYEFYKSKIPDVSNIHDLNKALKSKELRKSLEIREEELLKCAGSLNFLDLPDEIRLSGIKYSLTYTYSPGSPKDGVTIEIRSRDLCKIPENLLSFFVPGLRREKIKYLLKMLPKRSRKRLVPIPDTADNISGKMEYRERSFISELKDILYRDYGVDTLETTLREEDLPENLRFRIVVTDEKGNPLRTGRYPGIMQEISDEAVSGEGDPSILEEKTEKDITIDSLKEKYQPLSFNQEDKGLSLNAYPAFTSTDRGVDLRYYAEKEKADLIHAKGCMHLLSRTLSDNIASFKKSLSSNKRLRMYIKPWMDIKSLTDSLGISVKETLIYQPPPAPLKKEKIANRREELRRLINAESVALVEEITEFLPKLSETISLIDKHKKTINSDAYKNIEDSLREHLRLYPEMLSTGNLSIRFIHQLNRYIKGEEAACEKGFNSPSKYRSFEKHLSEFYKSECTLLNKRAEASLYEKSLIDEYILYLHEYRLSLFAPSVKGKPFPVSAKRVEKRLEYVQKKLR